MTEQVNVYEAKTRLSKLLERVEAGEEIVIARNGRPIARLVPNQPERPSRRPGAWAGKGWIADDFDDPGGGWGELIDQMVNGPVGPSPGQEAREGDLSLQPRERSPSRRTDAG